MTKLNAESLNRLRKAAKNKMNLNKLEAKARVTVHMGTCGIASGAEDVLDALEHTLKDRNINDVLVKTSGCAGLCSHEPMVTVELKSSPPVKYIQVTPKSIARIVDEHIENGQIVKDCALAIGSEKMS